MRHFLAALALGGTAVAWAGGDVRKDSKEFQYNVSGTTAQQVLDDMRRQAQRVGEDYFAEAKWRIDWRYDYDRPTRNACRVKDLRVYLTERVTLPHWTGAGAATALVAQWQSFVAAVRQHELGHLAHGRQAANDVRDELQKLRARDCEILEQRADETGTSIVKRYAAMDVEYDARTEHGKTQGAWWTVEAPTRVAAPAPAR